MIATHTHTHAAEYAQVKYKGGLKSEICTLLLCRPIHYNNDICIIQAYSSIHSSIHSSIFKHIQAFIQAFNKESTLYTSFEVQLMSIVNISAPWKQGTVFSTKWEWLDSRVPRVFFLRSLGVPFLCRPLHSSSIGIACTVVLFDTRKRVISRTHFGTQPSIEVTQCCRMSSTNIFLPSDKFPDHYFKSRLEIWRKMSRLFEGWLSLFLSFH